MLEKASKGACAADAACFMGSVEDALEGFVQAYGMHVDMGSVQAYGVSVDIDSRVDKAEGPTCSRSCWDLSP